jgi:glutamine amidotransferase
MSSKIIIIDYGMGNLNSVKKMMERLKVNSVISSDAKDIISSHKIILPGVGHFGKAMFNLKQLNLIEILNEAVLVKKKPVLGICLGMQLMTKKSEEGNTEGLGWIDAEMVKFNVSDKIKYKIPHMGWNQIFIKKNSRLMNNIFEMSEFYFTHAYQLRINNRSDILNETEYDYIFPSAIEKDNIYGVQYHPEKSHDTGAQLLKNFIEL